MSPPVEKRRQWIKSRREQRKQTKYARLRRQFLRYSILATLLAFSVYTFYRIHCHLYENKSDIVLHGNLVTSNEQILEVLKPEVVATPLFLLNPNDLANKIESLSMVKHAFVRRYVLPQPKLKIEILEEFPWATISGSADDPAQYVIAESGRIISLSDFPNVYQPTLKIYTENPYFLNFRDVNVQQWANWTNYIAKQTQSAVLAIDMREPYNVKVDTSKFTIALGNPDSGLTKRLYRLASVLEVLANQHQEAAFVDLGLNSNIPVKLAKKVDKLNSDEKMTRL